RRHQRARCQAETPLIDLSKFAEPALYTKIGQLTVERDFLARRRRALSLTERASVSDVTTLQVQRESTLTLQNFRSL
ncbi:hypothetical protein, partial [Bradyrhizobium cosmicum]|uniref:hypothetical protein n=1 Tax=Bradyrhizobium cosmicum TaxID=1404864 RepID=UPI0028ECE124